MRGSDDAIVILGGTGFVGRAMARRWRSEDRPLRYLVHRQFPAWMAETAVDALAVNLDDGGSVAAGVAGAQTAINLLRPVGDGWYPRQMRTLLPHLSASGISRLVHASSIDVYGGSPARIVDETTPTQARSAYEREHRETEDLVLNQFPDAIVARLGAIFGPGGKNVVRLAEEIKAAPPWKLAARRMLYGERRMHLVSVETVCRALALLCALPPPLSSRRFVVTDDGWDGNNFAHVQEELLRAFGRPAPSGPMLPSCVIKAVLALTGKAPGLVDRRFSGEALRQQGFQGADFPAELAHYARFLANGSNDLT